MNNPVQYDIVMPFHRPHPGWDDHTAENITALRNYFSGKNCTLHFYITNDGGKGYAPEELEHVKQAAGGAFDFLSYEKNHGKGYSLRFAMAQTKGDFQVYTDGDFPFGWEAVAKAFEVLEAGADVVMGQRGADYRGGLCFARKVLSFGARCLNRVLLGIPSRYLDAQAGLKGFNAAGKEQFLKTTVDTFVFDTEFILLSWCNHLKIETFPISVRPGLSFSRMGMKTVIRELKCFLRVLWKIRVLRKY